MAVDDGVLTFHDMLDYITALTDGGARTKDLRLHKEAILGAYRDITMCHEWDYYMKEGRVDLVANQTSSTIAYDHTGGANERQVTLASGTWPGWAKYGRIRFNDVVYPVESKVSGSDVLLTLGEDLNPGADVAALTTYDLYRSVYSLPADLWRLYDVAVEKSYWITYYLTPTEWLQRERFTATTGQTWAWTIMKDPDNDNRFALWVDPAPSTAEPLGFIYRRRPRTLRWAGTETEARTYTFGSRSIGNDSLVTSTALPASMVGSVVRLANSTTTHPTGLAGSSPYAEQFKIASLSGTTVSLDSALTQAYAGGTNKLVVSDPIDMNDTMLEAFKAQVEYRLSRFANDLQDMTASKGVAEMELRRSLEAEARVSSSGGARGSRYDYLFSHLQNIITTSSDPAG